MPREYLIMLPGPTNVPSRVIHAMSRALIGHRGPEFHELLERIVENAKYLFQTKNDVFVLTSSGTGGIEAAISNIVRRGDKVIVPVLGVFSERLKTTVERCGGVAVDIDVEWGNGVTAEQVKSAIEENPDAKAVAVVYNDTATGVTVRDLPKISEIVKRNGLLLVIDAISILGGDELPVDKWRIDVCVTGVQKCLACPPGLALVSISEDAWRAVRENEGRSFYFDFVAYKEFYERKKETPYTPAIPLFYALDEALRLVREEGLERRIERHKTCAEAFYSAMESLELELFARKEFRSNTVIAVKNPEGISDFDLRKLMREEHRVLIAGGMGRLAGTMFRIGNMGVVSEREVLTTLVALEDSLRRLGYDLEPRSGVNAALEVFERKGSGNR